jgi:hypothetical protein
MSDRQSPTCILHRAACIPKIALPSSSFESQTPFLNRQEIELYLHKADEMMRSKRCIAREVISPQHPVGEASPFSVHMLKIATISGLFRASQHFTYCSNYRPIGLLILQLDLDQPYLQPHLGLRLWKMWKMPSCWDTMSEVILMTVSMEPQTQAFFLFHPSFCDACCRQCRSKWRCRCRKQNPRLEV